MTESCRKSERAACSERWQCGWRVVVVVVGEGVSEDQLDAVVYLLVDAFGEQLVLVSSMDR